MLKTEVMLNLTTKVIVILTSIVLVCIINIKESKTETIKKKGDGGGLRLSKTLWTDGCGFEFIGTYSFSPPVNNISCGVPLTADCACEREFSFLESPETFLL